MTEAREQRISRERQEMGLRPWQFAPSEIDDGPNHYARTPACAGYAAWEQAKRWRAKIRQRDPHYFDGDA
jgi:hypothetical protein